MCHAEAQSILKKAIEKWKNDDREDIGSYNDKKHYSDELTGALAIKRFLGPEIFDKNKKELDEEIVRIKEILRRKEMKDLYQKDLLCPGGKTIEDPEWYYNKDYK